MTMLLGKAQRIALIGLFCVLSVTVLQASDHADPISYFNTFKQEGGITDLFVFPELDKNDKDGKPILDAHGRPENMVVILCVRRLLANQTGVTLAPYEYKVHMDLNGAVTIGNPETDPGTARYGGTVARPEMIDPTLTFTMHLYDIVDKGEIRHDELKVDGPLLGGVTAKDIGFYTGVRDDPFIFPRFSQSNVVAMVLKIPMKAFSPNQNTWMVWGTSSKSGKQLDHVGRSLRTQQPRFDMLNTLPPKEHVAAIKRERNNPSLMFDLGVFFGLGQLFQYRDWDDAPDVMIYALKNTAGEELTVGFPNGRKLTDDVAQLLARYGDTLLFELSYSNKDFPRKTKYEAFKTDFPYLAEPQDPARPPVDAPRPLSTRNRLILLAIAVAIPVFWFGTAWLLARYLISRKLRLRYL